MKKSISVIFVLFIVFASSLKLTHAEGECPFAFLASYFSEYKDAVRLRNGLSGKQKGAKVSKIIGEIFAPVTKFFHKKTKSLGTKEIQQIYLEISKNFPLSEVIRNPYYAEKIFTENRFEKIFNREAFEETISSSLNLQQKFRTNEEIVKYHENEIKDLKLQREELFNKGKFNGLSYKSFFEATINSVPEIYKTLTRQFLTIEGENRSTWSRFEGVRREAIFIQPGYLSDQGFVRGLLNLTIGEYGEDLTRDLLITYQVIVELMKRNILKASLVVSKNNRDILYTETARAREAKKIAEGIISKGAELEYSGVLAKDFGVYRTYIEGFFTIAQSLSVLLTKKVPGLDYTKAVEMLLSQKRNEEQSRSLISDFSVMVPVGFVGPSAHLGLHHHMALELKGQQLIFSQSYAKLLKEMKSAQRKDNYENTGLSHVPNYSGVGCPLGFKAGPSKEVGNDMVSKIFLKVFKVVNFERKK